VGLFGQAADRYVRKTVLTWSLVWYVVATAIWAFQQTGQALNWWRLIARVGFGVQLVAIDTYRVELMPPSLRGRAFSVNQCICFAVVPVADPRRGTGEGKRLGRAYMLV
jgi:putative MFS transporter